MDSVEMDEVGAPGRGGQQNEDQERDKQQRRDNQQDQERSKQERSRQDSPGQRKREPKRVIGGPDRFSTIRAYRSAHQGALARFCALRQTQIILDTLSRPDA